VLEQYPEKVKLVFKNYPLRSHSYAKQSAIAALAAGEQGKFWEFHDLLFENYNKLSDDKINEIATSLNLDAIKFQEDLKNPEIAAQIQQDVVDGNRAEVRGTPAIFINGRLVRNRSLNGFRKLIEDELQKLKIP
jgi:protein-disulfide isomerase